MRKPLIALVACGALVGIIIFIGGQTETKEVNDAEKEKAFKVLLNDWQLVMPVTYKVTHYKELSSRSEWGTTPMYFRVDVPKEQSGSWLTWLNDPRFTGKDTVLGADNPGSFPVVPNSESTKKILWSIRPELSPQIPKIDWWKAGAKSGCLYGFVETSDTHQYIRFDLVEGSNGVWIFVESLSRKSEKK